MSFIHNRIPNRILRSIFKPFKKILPDKFRFPINGKISIKLTEGKKILITGNPTSNLLRVLYWYGIRGFEYNEYKIFTKIIKKCNFFLDIGANIGYYTLLAKKMNPSIAVVSFEPMLEINKVLDVNININKFDNVKTENIALSDRKGTSKFYSYKNNKLKKFKDQLVGDGSLVYSNTPENSTRVSEVVTDTLDNYLQSNLLKAKVDFMKIDTEGTEDIVLSGAKNVLKTNRPIIMCEVIKGRIEAKIEKIMFEHNYIFYVVTNNGLEKREKIEVENAKDDFFFIPIEENERILKLIKE